MLVALIVVATLKSRSFLFSSDGWRDLLLTPSILLLLAVGQTVVIITRNVDLSVGSILGLTAYLTGRLFVDHPGLPIVVVFLAGLAWAPCSGLVNGVLVAFGKVPALVITLGTLYIYRGIFLTWAGSDRINASDMPARLPRPRHQVGPRHPGADDHRARRAGDRRLLPLHRPRRPRALRDRLRPRRRRALRPQRTPPRPRRVRRSAVRSPAWPACCYAARYGTVSSGAGYGIELQAVGAAVIGGVAIFGGSGTVWGAAIGAFLLVTINRALPILGISDFWQRAVVGALIIAAIVLDRVLVARQERKLVAARRDEEPVMSTSDPDRAPERRRRAPTRRTPGRCGARVLLTREFAVIALLVAVFAYANGNVAELRRPADALLPVPRHGADPADRAADDAGHHHRRDRPVGGQRRRA